METHLILLGPSTAGKTSLMLGLAKEECKYDFKVDRTITTRPQRPNEGDTENIFVNSVEFESRRSELLFPFSTFPTYEYGIVKQPPLAPAEIRMRILTPLYAQKFRRLVSEQTLFCSIAPYDSNPESVFKRRDPNVDPADLASRMERFYKDQQEADEIADIKFQNSNGLDGAVKRLSASIIKFVDQN